MIRFDTDYTEGAHPQLLNALVESNFEQTEGYSEDKYCEEARNIIRQHCKNNELGVEFMIGGTQTNVTVIDALLKSYQAPIAANTGHINVHETGAPEATGHKIIALTTPDGRLTCRQIEECYDEHWNNPVHEHTIQPGMVYLSYPAENGLIYSKKELEDISHYCHNNNLYLFVDGARMGYGLASEECDMTLSDFANLCDVFYIGGTKIGALFGEAVIFKDKELKRSFRYAMKQHGGMLAKGRLLGIQFKELLKSGNNENCLYFQLSTHADYQAERIKQAFIEKHIPMWIDSKTNMQFPLLTKKRQETLSKKYVFEVWSKYDDKQDVVRFCTSWATKNEHVSELCKDIKNME